MLLHIRLMSLVFSCIHIRFYIVAQESPNFSGVKADSLSGNASKVRARSEQNLGSVEAVLSLVISNSSPRSIVCSKGTLKDKTASYIPGQNGAIEL